MPTAYVGASHTYDVVDKSRQRANGILGCFARLRAVSQVCCLARPLHFRTLIANHTHEQAHDLICRRRRIAVLLDHSNLMGQPLLLRPDLVDQSRCRCMPCLIEKASVQTRRGVGSDEASVQTRRQSGRGVSGDKASAHHSQSSKISASVAHCSCRTCKHSNK